MKVNYPHERPSLWQTRVYTLLGKIHMALVTVAGCLVVLAAVTYRRQELTLDLSLLLFGLAFVACDLIRITFLRGKTI